MQRIPFSFHRKIYRSISLIVPVLLLLTWPTQPTQAQSPDDATDVTAALAIGESVRVIVALRSPEAGVVVGIRVAEIEQSQEQVLDELSDQEFTLIHQYDTIPGLVGEVTAAGLETLRQQPAVEAIALDLPVEATLTESVSLIGADTVWTELGFTGAGVNVAVLDTGIDPTHPDLADHLVAQKCFTQGTCPPDDTDESDDATDQNGHGTHIAGIITGRGETSPPGVTPDAGVVAVRVLNDNGSGYTSDVVAGIDWVVAHREQFNIKIINLSLGGGRYSNECDQADANTLLYAQAIEAARQAGLTVFAASGNSGLADEIMAPACVSGVVAVGSTYDTDFGPISLGGVCTDDNAVVDQVACLSNSSSTLDLLAPGVAINSTALGGGQSSLSGTSMATAHAAAVAALMLQADPELTPVEVETVLKETGVPVIDSRNGRGTPRLDALAAVTRIVGGEVVTISGTVLLQGRTDHSGTGIFLSEDSCPTVVSGVPEVTAEADGSFELGLPSGQDYQCLQAVQSGYLLGQQNSPGGNLGVITLPGGDVTADGLIDIFDLAFIAARYDTTDPAADINVDGLVDIFDLVIAAGNYDRRGPVTTWE